MYVRESCREKEVAKSVGWN